MATYDDDARIRADLIRDKNRMKITIIVISAIFFICIHTSQFITGISVLKPNQHRFSHCFQCH